RGQVKGAVHPYIGQEASGVGVCMALRKNDLIAGTHRSHGHNLSIDRIQLAPIGYLFFDKIFF
ncbi:MAG TPA: hypothetical protein ENI15_04145, partial [Spirochaetes bacterium]|nr:hypothetical protein [Spirochaetota bacterium]